MADIDSLKFNCNRCGHTWLRRVNIPKRCPQCGSPYWNTARTRKVAKKIV